MAKPKPLPFSKLVAALLNDQEPFPPRYLHRFSDLSSEDGQILAQTWPKIPAPRRVTLMEDLEELSQADDLLSFEEVCRLAIKDPHPQVRLSAVKILHDYELTQFIPTFTQLAQGDADTLVRAAAAAALGAFIYLGEVDKLHPSTLNRVEDTLFSVLHGQDESQVRQRALESLGFSSREDVAPAIEQAYANPDAEWLIAALNAMGRSADRKWKSRVLAMLDDQRPLVRAEAASAAGELEIKSAAPALLKLLKDSDLDVRMAAIWALSQLGGKGVRKALEKMLANADDDDEASLLESALDNLDFTEDLGTIALLKIDDAGDDDEDLFPDTDLDEADNEGDSQA